uniref:Small ribosomal subunit protein uS19c n=1 Tax=Zantedeschia elliottiana TaxID=94108 RepID=A0A6M3W2K6_9ARAE|nr:ribosomal protein S19 [Zantedeschia elliottiana]QJF46654.1 ribosomal protein S19 [Zantedeschia elliottiana]
MTNSAKLYIIPDRSYKICPGTERLNPRLKKKKNVFIANYLSTKLYKITRASGKKQIIRTWSRASGIIPQMVGHTIAVHNGKIHLPVYITYRMVGRKLGDFAPTVTFEKHTPKQNDNRSRRQSIEKRGQKQNDKRSRRQSHKSK